MPSRSVNQVLSAPFVVPVFRGDLTQWAKDLAVALDIRMKEYGNAINQTIESDEDSRLALLIGSSNSDERERRSSADLSLMAMLSGALPDDDEAIRRQAMGV